MDVKTIKEQVSKLYEKKQGKIEVETKVIKLIGKYLEFLFKVFATMDNFLIFYNNQYEVIKGDIQDYE